MVKKQKVLRTDVQSKKSRELINSIMVSDEASEEIEFLSALNASLESFVHKTPKEEQIECIRRIICHGRDVLAVLPMGFGKNAIHQTCCFICADSQRHIKKPPSRLLW